MPTTRSIGEEARLSALRNYDILDTPPDERFDRVARLAKRWFDVPIVLISFLDEEREWFKTAIGMDQREISREIAFCEYTVRNHAVMVVEDATEDPRFADNPLVTEHPGLRFYAGAPLITPDDYSLGALCVLDTTARSCAPDDLDVLKDLAGIVSDELELRAAYKKVEERTQQAESLAEALTQAEESERRRLSQLLHDDLQQVLHSARMRIETFRENNSFSESKSKRVAQIETKIGEALEITRTLSSQFAPPIGKNSLRDALDWLAMKMQETQGLSVSVRARGPAVVTNDALKTLLFRLVRELLFNVVKHADTNQAEVLLVEGRDHLRVVVEDEGKGFDPEKEVEGGYGLANIRDRIEVMGGTVRINSQPGAGTRVVIEVPRAGEE